MSKLEIWHECETNLDSFIKNDLRIGFIGAGNMARSLVKGLLRGESVNKNNILVSAPTDRNRHHYEQLGVDFCHDNQHVVDSSNVIFLAVKPYLLKEVVAGLTNLTIEKLVFSVAAGVSMQAHLDFGLSQCIFGRLMPTVPIEVGAGVCTYCFASHIDNIAIHEELIQKLFGNVAIVEKVAESQIDLIAALGSATAFMCEAIQGLTYGLVKMGLPLHIAARLTPQVALGTAKVIQDSGKHPAEVADRIYSPGGTTVYGLHALEKGGLRTAMMDAIEAAVLRAGEMAGQNK